jgi:hypothetical protein
LEVVILVTCFREKRTIWPVKPLSDFDSKHPLQSLHQRRFAVLDPQPMQEPAMEDYRKFRMEVAAEAERQGSLYQAGDDPNLQLPSITSALYTYVKMKKFMYGRRLYPHRWRVKRLPAVTAYASRDQ